MHQFLYDKKTGESFLQADGSARPVGPILTDIGQKKNRIGCNSALIIVLFHNLSGKSMLY